MVPHLRWPLVGAALATLTMGGWWLGTADEATGERVRLSRLSQYTHWAKDDELANPGRVSEPAQPRGGGVRSPAEIEQALFVHGSLRGTELDGDWGVDAKGQLQPSRALRRRFDQLLTAQGEASREELGIWLQAKATAELGEAAAGSIMQMWQQYLVLEGQSYRYAVQLDDPASLRWALQERQVMRRAVLGAAWADAFFADEEQLLIGQLEARQSPTGPVPASAPAYAQLPHLNEGQAHALRSEQLGSAAADRLAALDRQEAQWQQRLSLAQAQWGRLSGAAHLSPLQQQADMAQWLETHFDARERVRVQAVLGL